MGLPLIGGHLGQVAIGFTDAIMLGWYGVEELAAITIAGSYMHVFFLFGSGFAWAMMPMVAAFAAKDDGVSIRRATRMSLWLSVLFAVLALPALLFAKPVFILLRQDAEVAVLAAQYLQIAGFGILPALCVMAIKSYLAALERTAIVFWATLLAALANGVANYALIFGHWGAPELGIAGAALASILIQFLMLAVVTGYALYVLPEHTLFRRIWRADWPMFSQVFRLGLPIGFTTLAEVGIFFAAGAMMGAIGTIPQAAHGIVMNITALTFMVHLGLSNVATIRVGNALGRGDRAHLERGARMVIAMSVCAALLTAVVFVSIPGTLVWFFQPEDSASGPEVLRIGVTLLAISALFQLFDGGQVICLGLLRGMKDTAQPMWLAGLSYWAIGVPTSAILGFVLGLEGVGIWLGLTLGLVFASALLFWRFWYVVLPAFGPAARPEGGSVRDPAL